MAKTMHREIMDAVKALRGASGVFEYDDDDFVVVDATDEEAEHATALLNYLPEIIHEHMILTKLVADLLPFIADQQCQIAALATRLDQVEAGQVAVKLQESGNDIVAKLTSAGTSIGEHSYRVGFEASTRTSGAGRKSGTFQDARHVGVGIGTRLDGLCATIAGLEASIDVGVDTSHSARIKEAWSKHEESTRRGEIAFSWKDIRASRGT